MGEPWRVRVEDDRAAVHGAGTLLDESFVLTCAHVVDGCGTQALVRVHGRPDELHPATVVARVTPDLERNTGDVAVLELAEPVTGAPKARLQRKWSRDDVVRCFGFGQGFEEIGTHARGVIQDYGMGYERVQLDAHPSGLRITEGFSGAAALNEADEICGVIVSVDRDGHDASWMIDVTAIVKHAGDRVRTYLADRPSTDERFTDPGSQPSDKPSGSVLVALEQALVEWLGSDDPGGVVTLFGKEQMAILSRLVGLTVPDYRAQVPAVERRTELPIGSVDAAVDASGRTADAVATAIAEALGLRIDDGHGLIPALEKMGPPVTVVVNYVDAADDPGELCEHVLRPVAVLAPLLRVRLVLGFADWPPGDLADVVVID